ncbi:MAG: alpha-glucosidase [Oscillospiraceae bacterium]|nr:alpha-glucosidase [Oscillospiraceae bacterium]
MLSSHLSGGIWTLCLRDHPLLVSTPDKPFATAVRREKTYKANRGTVKETVTETARVPLTSAALGEDGSVILSGEGHSLSLTWHAVLGGAELCLAGERGWAYEFCLPAAEDEAVFGGGEQYRKVNLRGEHVVNFVSEHIKAATVLEKALLPHFLYREKKHADIGSYAPMPIFVTDRRRLILFDTTSDGYADLTGQDSLRFIFDSCPRSLTLLKAKSYEDLARLLAARIPNRQYLPGWCHDGMILSAQGGTRQILDKTFKLLDAGAKISAVWSQDWSGCNRTVMGYQVWWNWEADEKLYPNLQETIRQLNARGVRFLAYINPYLVKGSRLYDFCKKQGYLITHTDGSVYHIKSTTFDAGMLDLTNPAAVKYIKETLIGRNMLDLGVSGWMADFGEYLPVDCVLHDGDPAALHNEWPVMWARINREAIEEYGAKDVMFFTRSGYLGIQSYAPILWNGDQHTDYTRDYGMPCVLPASFSLAFSGVTMVHCDIGGFFSFLKLRRDAELFTRWMELSTFSLLMRSHESIRPQANAQPYDEGLMAQTVRLTRLHTALKPYLLQVSEAAGRGLPALRPDFWYAEDYAGSRDPYAYFLGDDLFVAPVIKKGVKKRRVFLPEGEWVCFWSGKEYRGERHYTVPAPLGQPPVFYRKTSSYAALFRHAAETIDHT